MSGLLFVLCCAAGLGLYFGVVRPFFIPLSWRIPTGRAYRANLGTPQRAR
jgi:hypothetical protein